MAIIQTSTASERRASTSSLIGRVDLQTSVPPLPCRGCTINCPDYPQCKGKPWRLSQTLGTTNLPRTFATIFEGHQR